MPHGGDGGITETAVPRAIDQQGRVQLAKALAEAFLELLLAHPCGFLCQVQTEQRNRGHTA